jgi:hypothetical protein
MQWSTSFMSHPSTPVCKTPACEHSHRHYYCKPLSLLAHGLYLSVLCDYIITDLCSNHVI